MKKRERERESEREREREREREGERERERQRGLAPFVPSPGERRRGNLVERGGPVEIRIPDVWALRLGFRPTLVS